METSKIKKGKSKTTYLFFFILNFDRLFFQKHYINTLN